MNKKTNINIRVNIADKEMLKLRAYTAGMTLSEYILNAAMNYDPWGDWRYAKDDSKSK